MTTPNTNAAKSNDTIFNEVIIDLNDYLDRKEKRGAKKAMYTHIAFLNEDSCHLQIVDWLNNNGYDSHLVCSQGGWDDPVAIMIAFPEKTKATSPYQQIEGMLSAEAAADQLVFHATNIADAIKRNDNCFFESRVTSMNAVTALLSQYVNQTKP